MWSPTRKALGVGPDGYLGEWHAFRQYVVDVSGSAADELIVWFEEDLLPGYAWSFPLPDGRANVGFGVLRDGSRSGKDARDLWAGLLDRPHIAAALGPQATPEGRHLAWPIPARVDQADARPRAGPVHRRRRRGDRRDDRRRHRPGPAHRTPRRLGDRRRRHQRRHRRAVPPARALRAGRRPSCVGAARPRPAPSHREPTGRWRSSPTRDVGAGATSPAGCSRTSLGRSP